MTNPYISYNGLLPWFYALKHSWIETESTMQIVYMGPQLPPELISLYTSLAESEAAKVLSNDNYYEKEQEEIEEAAYSYALDLVNKKGFELCEQ